MKHKTVSNFRGIIGMAPPSLPPLLIFFLLLTNLVTEKLYANSDQLFEERNGILFKKFSKSTFSGNYAEYWENGKTSLRVKGNYRNGRKEGAWMAFFENSNLSWRGSFLNGKKNGRWVEYYENGKIYYQSHFLNGLNDGPSTFFHKSGQLGSKGKYQKGKRVGKWLYYSESGVIDEAQSGTYNFGVKQKN